MEFRYSPVLRIRVRIYRPHPVLDLAPFQMILFSQKICLGIFIFSNYTFFLLIKLRDVACRRSDPDPVFSDVGSGSRPGKNVAEPPNIVTLIIGW
jgi:hypothetical protein